MPLPVSAAAVSRMWWLTDRSRLKLGMQRCARARYLAYHAGPTGCGYTAKHESLPLVTGIAVHEGLAAFTHHLKTRRYVPSAAEARLMISLVVAAYIARV